MFHTIGYIDARLVVKAIDSSIADKGMVGRCYVQYL